MVQEEQGLKLKVVEERAQDLGDKLVHVERELRATEAALENARLVQERPSPPSHMNGREGGDAAYKRLERELRIALRERDQAQTQAGQMQAKLDALLDACVSPPRSPMRDLEERLKRTEEALEAMTESERVAKRNLLALETELMREKAEQQEKLIRQVKFQPCPATPVLTLEPTPDRV